MPRAGGEKPSETFPMSGAVEGNGPQKPGPREVVPVFTHKTACRKCAALHDILVINIDDMPNWSFVFNEGIFKVADDFELDLQGNTRALHARVTTHRRTTDGRRRGSFEKGVEMARDL